jgi:hypothetical protein
VAIAKHILRLESGVVRFARLLAVAGIEHSQQPPARRLFLVRFWRRMRVPHLRELVVYTFEKGHGPLAWGTRRERNHFFGVPSHGNPAFPVIRLLPNHHSSRAAGLLNTFAPNGFRSQNRTRLPSPGRRAPVQSMGHPLFIRLPRETVWKIRIGCTLGSHETVKRGEKSPCCRFCATKTRDLVPSSYFPNSF